MSRKPVFAAPNVVPLFQRGPGWANVPEVTMPKAPAAQATLPVAAKAVIDLADKPKALFVFGAGGSGKTVWSRWATWRMGERGSEAILMALDPGARALAGWFDGVQQPPTRDAVGTARWLREGLDFLITNPRQALLDFGGGGELALESVSRSAPDLAKVMEDAGLGVVSVVLLSPRVDDIDILDRLAAAGFKPRATALVLNTGRADPNLPIEESFWTLTNHSVFRRAVEQGAATVWMPALESDVMLEIEAKRLDFGMARDGQVPEGASFYPIGGLRRSAVGRWLAEMEAAHTPVASWLP
jgi:hypothetical protein